MLSATCRYGLSATLYLAQRNAPMRVPVRVISEALRIPHIYLRRVLGKLVHHGVLTSHRGSRGGVALARSADAIVLMDIIRVLEEEPVLRLCLINRADCKFAGACLVDERIREVQMSIRVLFEHMTLADAARQSNPSDGPFRLLFQNGKSTDV